MRKSLLSLALVLMLAAPAAAAPVVVSPVLGVSIQGLAPLTVGGVGTISVTGSTVVVPAGLVSLPAGTTIVVPVTGTSVINTLSISKLSNLAGTFVPGGVTAQAPGEVCPVGGPASGEACNAGGGLGGAMALTGTINVNIIPGIVVIPVNLNVARIGQGGSTNSPFDIDAAAWTTGTGLVNTGVNVVATTGSPTLQLVSPTFVNALGNVLPIFARLILADPPLPLPESSSFLLIAAGVAGLAWLRR